MISIVIPVRDEAGNVRPLFESLAAAVKPPAEAILVYDSDNDPTIAQAERCRAILPWELRLIKNGLGPGPANAIRAGFAAAVGDAIVVVMADLSDDFPLIDRMYARIQAGDDVVCASRYMRGGRQIGGPFLKRTLSRMAGISLYHFGLPTHDATNAFKMYRAKTLRRLNLQGDGGFEISLEIVTKAWLAGQSISELPGTWTDRAVGTSKFRLWRWLPRYLRWYRLAMTRRVRGGPS